MFLLKHSDSLKNKHSMYNNTIFYNLCYAINKNMHYKMKYSNNELHDITFFTLRQWYERDRVSSLLHTL